MELLKRTLRSMPANTTTFRRQNLILTTIPPFLNMLKLNLTSAMQKNTKSIQEIFAYTMTTSRKNFKRQSRSRQWQDGSTTAWISNPEVLDKSACCFVSSSDGLFSAPDVPKIMQVLLGLTSHSELSDNDAVYLTGLSKDVYFAQFLASLGRKAVRWALAKNVQIPPLPSNRDFITPARLRFVRPVEGMFPVEGMLHARTVLRMLGAHTLGTVHPELITILNGVVVHWLEHHVYSN